MKAGLSKAGAMCLALFVLGQTTGAAAITYVDATVSNTTLAGAQLEEGSNYTSGAAEGLMDNLWHLRTGLGNGTNGVWTADEAVAGSEDVMPLVTTITIPQAGGYELYVYVWDSEDAGEDWDVRVRVGPLGSFTLVRSSEAETANGGRFNGSIVTSESGRRLVQVPLGTLVTGVGESIQVYVDDDATIGSRRTWYDGVGYEKVFGSLGERVIAIDFNKTNTPGAPSQARFRIVAGSSTVSQNSTNITKNAGPYGIQLSKSTSTAFEFRGANGDTTRSIAGGPTGLSALVADLIGSRDGTIQIGISNLAAGTYLFRSYHLEPFNTSNLGFAQGSSPTTPNTLRAFVSGSLQALTQPTALSSSGLATNFISDTDIPKLAFPFSADGSNAVTIQLSTVYTNGADSFIFMNGFEVFATAP